MAAAARGAGANVPCASRSPRQSSPATPAPSSTAGGRAVGAVQSRQRCRQCRGSQPVRAAGSGWAGARKLEVGRARAQQLRVGNDTHLMLPPLPVVLGIHKLRRHGQRALSALEDPVQLPRYNGVASFFLSRSGEYLSVYGRDAANEWISPLSTLRGRGAGFEATMTSTAWSGSMM